MSKLTTLQDYDLTLYLTDHGKYGVGETVVSVLNWGIEETASELCADQIRIANEFPSEEESQDMIRKWLKKNLLAFLPTHSTRVYSSVEKLETNSPD